MLLIPCSVDLEFFAITSSEHWPPVGTKPRQLLTRRPRLLDQQTFRCDFFGCWVIWFHAVSTGTKKPSGLNSTGQAQTTGTGLPLVVPVPLFDSATGLNGTVPLTMLLVPLTRLSD